MRSLVAILDTQKLFRIFSLPQFLQQAFKMSGFSDGAPYLAYLFTMYTRYLLKNKHFLVNSLY